MADLVSTIIPVFNRPKLLLDAVESVFSQSYRPIEIIIVDDQSTDETLAVAQGLADKHEEISVVRAHGEGPGAAREAGRQSAVGKYIQYLDSDDVLLPEKFSQQVFKLQAQPQADICYGKETRRELSYQFAAYDEFEGEAAIKSTGSGIQQIFPHILHDSLWGTSVPLWRRSFTNKLGSWLALLNEEDIEYDSRAGANHAVLTWVDEFVAVQRVHDQHLSAGGMSDPLKLSHRLQAKQKIYKHALSSGAVKVGDADMQHFAKNVFHIARMFAAHGMKQEMKEALQLAEKANGKKTLPMRLYGLSTLCIGAKLTQSLFARLEQRQANNG